MSTDIFTATTRPDPDLFYRRGDTNDRRIGDLAQTDPADYASAHVVILGCPQDEGVRRNRGRPGAAAAPSQIRAALYRMGVDGIEQTRLFDLGDTRIQLTLEATHDLQRLLVERIIRDGKLLISIGGGNDLAYPDAAGLAGAAGRVLALNIDAHYDVRADLVRNSGTPYRQLLEEGHLAPERLVQLGSQPFANSPAYTRYLHERGVRVYPLSEVRARGAALLGEILQTEADAVFWGIDMDVVRAADAPGVSAPNPLGMSSEEICQIANIAGAHPRTRLIEITEVNPTFDIDQRTCRLAAAVIWHAMAAAAGRAPSAGG